MLLPWLTSFAVLSLLLLLLPTFSSAGDLFLSNDRCSMLLSGSRARSVRSAFLDCEQGALVWENPSGSLLATFSAPPDSLHDSDKKWRICFRFPEPLPEGTIVQRIANSLLQSPLAISQELSLHCFPGQRVQLYIQTHEQQQSGSDWRENGPRSVGLYYAIEEAPERKEGDSSQCGLCSQTQFLRAFCSANFVFTGKLLRHSVSANSLDFSAESPLLRRPLLLSHIVGPGQGEIAQFNITTLFADCSGQSPWPRPSLHSRLVVVANAQLGFGRLLCLLDYSQFRQIPLKEAPCDIRLPQSG